MPLAMPNSVRSYLREPAVPNPPVRVWRDLVLVALVSVSAILEATLRSDAEWVEVPVGWRIAGVVIFFLTIPPALLIRRTNPLLATAWGFLPIMALGAAQSIATGTSGGLMTMAIVLVIPYALFRWGSGRDGGTGVAILLASWIVGTFSDAASGPSEWIGGFIILSLPVEIGLMVRYRDSARRRAIREAKSREREDLARELHDTVAHHVSAIAVQAQAGRALAASDPERALQVLGVIEEAASRTLGEMREMVRTLRDDAAVELAPRQGIADLAGLASDVPGDLRIDVDVADQLGFVGPSVDAAIYRIAQESITNAVRHARQATQVRVRVVPDGELVRLVVADDGMVGANGTEHGYGLLGMTERAELLGGTLAAGPANGRGWQVTAELPRRGASA